MKKVRKSCLRWFGHVQKKAINAQVKKSKLKSRENEKNVEEYLK